MVSPAPIEAHAVVGDGRSAALVDRAGAVTWLAWPRFDSPAVCAATKALRLCFEDAVFCSAT